MKKKSAFTILELMVSMLIIVIIMGCGLKLINSFQIIKEKEGINNSIYEIIDVFSYAKGYCRKNSEIGYVRINEKNKSIEFTPSIYNTKLKEVYMPKDVILVSNFSGGNRIKVSESGYITSAGKIEIRYKKKVVSTITISAGNDIINIK